MSSGTLETNWNKIVNGIKDNSLVIINIGAILVTWAAEEIVTGLETFTCPCSDRVLYASLFIFGPSLLLYGVGIMLNSATWKLLTGCCRTKKYHSSPLGKNTWFSKLFFTLIQSCPGALTWLVVTFMDGRYLVCAIVEPFACKSTNTTEVEEAVAIDEINAKALSQTTAWILLTSLITVGLLIFCCWKCFDRFTYEQRRYADIYTSTEETTYEKKASDKAKKDAEKTIKTFFEYKTLNPEKVTNETWKARKETWDDVTYAQMSYENRIGYTPLQYWSFFHEDEESDQESSGDPDKQPLLKKEKEEDKPSDSKSTEIQMESLPTTPGTVET